MITLSGSRSGLDTESWSHPPVSVSGWAMLSKMLESLPISCAKLIAVLYHTHALPAKRRAIRSLDWTFQGPRAALAPVLEAIGCSSLGNDGKTNMAVCDFG